jgi:sRNA-binding carbon storage regulator CsrA
VLVVSRHPGEETVLAWGPTTIVVRVCEVRDDGLVRVGFEAPRRVRILRRELLDITPYDRALMAVHA